MNTINDMISRMVSLPRRVGTDALRWINDNPLPTAGLTMATLSSGYLIVLIHRAATAAGSIGNPLGPTQLLAIARARPVYLLAIVVGIAVFVLWQE